MEKTKLVVIDEHTLGCIVPQRPKVAQVFRASVLRGSNHRDGDILFLYNQNVRLASEKDFDEFRVCFNGFNNSSNYEFQTTP